MSSKSKPANVAEALAYATQLLSEAGIQSARLDCLLLLSEVLQKSKAQLLAHPETALTKAAWHRLLSLLRRRATWEPIAYLLGHKEFYGRDFVITKDVLVPRPETEDLIALALDLPKRSLRVLDMGTGSGIIGITLALERPEWAITISDISEAALKVATQNVKHFGLSKSVTILIADLLGPEPCQYNAIVANLPYVPKSLTSKPDLTKEPSQALFSGNDGLDQYRRLWSQLHNSPPGYVITESLQSQHATLQSLAQIAGYALERTQGLGQLFSKN